MQILVTGGAGFVGRALVWELVAQGHNVRVVDDLSAGGDPARLPGDATFIRGDVNDLPRLWTALQGVECVYHLAARVSVSESVRYPRDYNTVNVGGTVSVLEAMRDVGVRRLVLASSGAIYGDQAGQPLHEALPPRPRSPYAVSKLAAEQYVLTVGQLWGVEAVCLRLFNVYGPDQQMPVTHAPVIPQFLYQALHGGSLVIHGDGSQTRDFVHADDVVRALVAAASAAEVNQQVINVGSGVETSINDLVALIGQAAGVEPHPLHVRSEHGGVSRMRADLARAAALLGYAPEVSLDVGLHRLQQADRRFAARPERRAVPGA